MSDLKKYNTTYVPDPIGLKNYGATCYFNSLIQALLSCPSIYEVLQENKDKEHFKESYIADLLYKLWNSALKGENIDKLIYDFWVCIIHISKGVLNQDQQDAHEGLMMFFNAIEKLPELSRLFEHRHSRLLMCNKCKEFVTRKKENNMVFEVQKNLQTEQLPIFESITKQATTLNEFLQKQEGYVDENHTCEKCKTQSAKLSISELVMCPEILPIVIKKYDNKFLTPFTEKLEFPTNEGKCKLVYKLVAQVEHSGNRSGGHYWAVCQRKNGIAQLNDSSVTPSAFGPTMETYMLFYHYIDTIES